MKKIWRKIEIPERIAKAVLTSIAALLTFGGPTYLMYVLEKLGVPHLLYLLLGLASFTAGVILFIHVLGKEPSI